MFHPWKINLKCSQTKCTCEHRASGNSSDGPNDDQLSISSHRYRGVEKMQASVDLHSTKAKTCAHPKKSRNHTEYINQVTRPSKDAIPNKRIEAGLHCKRQTLPVSHQGQKKPNNGVHHPTVGLPLTMK